MIDEDLSVTANNVQCLFDAALRIDRLQTDKNYLELRDVSERFQLWSISLGLYQCGHCSLDYRFRDSPSTQEILSSLLVNLCDNLQKLTREFEHHEEFEDQSQHDDLYNSDSSDSDLEELNQIPWAEIITRSIRTSVDRLYQIASQIQDPHLRTGRSQAKSYVDIDSETGIDLIETFAEYDRQQILDYIRSEWLSRRKESSIDRIHGLRAFPSDPTKRDSDFVHSCPDFLISRLTRANLLRRKQFRYWRKYHDKIQSKTGGQIQNEIINARSTQRSLALSSIPIIDVNSQLIGTQTDDGVPTSESDSYQQQAVSDRFHYLEIPQLPIRSKIQDKFFCPYCFILCSKETGYNGHWRSHVVYDLRPYVCTEAHCPLGDQLYETAEQWASHEVSHQKESLLEESISKDCAICGSPLESLEHIAQHLEVIAMFALPDLTDTDLDSLLLQSSKHGDIADTKKEAAGTIEAIVYERQKVKSDEGKMTTAFSTQSENRGHTLQSAAFVGLYKIAKMLLDSGADIEYDDPDYGRALKAASSNGHNEIVQMLLDFGADIDAESGDGDNALHAAVAENQRITVEILLSHGVRVNMRGGLYGSALQAACASFGAGYYDIVKLLLDAGAEVNAQGGLYGTALQAASASSEGRLDILELLLESGADVNIRGGKYGTALLAASICGHQETVQLLLACDADLNITSHEYGDALQAASFHGHIEIVQQLLDFGANVNAKGGLYGTALQAASASARPSVDIVRLLLDRGAGVNIRAGKYCTALQAASACGYDQIILYLLHYKADINEQGGRYGTALQAARQGGLKRTEKILLAAGADPYLIGDTQLTGISEDEL